MRALLCTFLLTCVLVTPQAEFIDETVLFGNFPNGFIWAAATAAYQVEGAWNVDGRTPSIWDTFVRIPGNVADGSTGDVACSSYYYYNKDVELLKSLGVSHYRFSISWSRVIPNGVGASNDLGIQYYKNLIAALKQANIQPMITLYHWDLPQYLEDMGGWQNASVADWFEAYADLCFKEFGADVKYWITFNEPWCTSYLGYGVGVFAPGIKETGTKDYIAGHNQLRAHARAYRLYESKYKSIQNGKVGITISIGWVEPEDNSNSAIEAAERALQFAGGWYAEPIFGSGNYPQVMIDQIGRKSAAAGLSVSRLPVFTDAEKAALKGSSDFFGLNTYSSELAKEQINDDKLISYDTDKDTYTYQDAYNWYGSASSWLRITPWGMRRILNWIKQRYNNPPIIITENGISDRNGYLDDFMRIYYYKYYINNVLKAIQQDGVDVIGYTAWSLMDNFEWGRGYTERFGLHYVNFSDPTRPRIPKSSAKYYARIVANNGFVPEEACDS